MNNTKGAMLILGSILISSVLTYLLTKAKYEKRPVCAPDIQEEPKQETEEKKTETQDKGDIMKYAEKYKRQYSELTRDYSPEQDERKRIEIIDEDTFNTNSEYEDTYYTLYSDNILTDEENVPITDPEDSVGRFVVERFNELEHNNMVHVRNHEYKLDIEIVRDLRTYSETLGGRANGRS